MTDTIEEITREQVALLLPSAIQRAALSYKDFMQQKAPLESKTFSEHHKAGMVAVSHLQLLLKLARWADLPRDNDDTNELATLLKSAEENLKHHEDQYSESGLQ